MRAMKNDNLASDKCARKKKPDMDSQSSSFDTLATTLNIPSKCGRPNENYIIP